MKYSNMLTYVMGCRGANFGDPRKSHKIKSKQSPSRSLDVRTLRFLSIALLTQRFAKNTYYSSPVAYKQPIQIFKKSFKENCGIENAASMSSIFCRETPILTKNK